MTAAATDSIYLRRKQLGPATALPPHRHECATLTLVLAGRLDEAFDRDDLSCGPWTLLFKPSGIRHTTACGGEGVGMRVVGLPEKVLAACGLDRIERPLHLRPGLLSTASFSLFEDSTAMPCSGAGLGEQLNGILDTLARTSSGSPDAPAWVREIEDRVSSPDTGPIDLHGWARRFGVHPNSVTRAFRRHYGCSIGEYRRRVRIDRAIDRLVADTSALSDLALELGYHDQSHFSREFKRETGRTPGEFRSLVRRPVRERGGVSIVQDRVGLPS